MKSHHQEHPMTAVAAVGFEKLGFDSVMPYLSTIQEAAALGCRIDWGDAETMPNRRSAVFSDPEEFKMPEDFLDRLPIKTVIDSIGMLRKKLGKSAIIIGKVMGPWTLSYHLRGLEDFLVETKSEPEKVREFPIKFMKITEKFAEAQLEVGADIITLADHATADLVSPETYKDFLLPVHKEINKNFPEGTFILHCWGHTLDRIRFFSEAGFQIFHFDSKNEIKEAVEAAGAMKLTGCVNNLEILLKGTSHDVRRQVNDIIDGGVKLISPECAIPLRVQNENLKEISDAVKGRSQ